MRDPDKFKQIQQQVLNQLQHLAKAVKEIHYTNDIHKVDHEQRTLNYLLIEFTGQAAWEFDSLPGYNTPPPVAEKVTSITRLEPYGTAD